MEKLKLKNLANIGNVLTSDELKRVYSNVGDGSGSGSGSEGSPVEREFTYPCIHGDPVKCTGYTYRIIKRYKQGQGLEYCIVCDEQEPVCCPTS